MHPTNALSPERLSANQRITEVAQLLANAFVRLKGSSSQEPIISDSDSESSLAISAHRSLHGETENANTLEEK